MAENEAPITDETVESVVQLVTAAEIYAASVGCKVSEAVRSMLLMMQAMTCVRTTGDLSALFRGVAEGVAGKVQ